MAKIKVLSVDDSALIRELLKTIVNSDNELEMVATAANPVFAERKIAEHEPDVITLDIEMPQMDGITFLKKIMSESPRPVIMFSSLLEAHRELTLDALSIGAFDYVLKPSTNVKEAVSLLRDTLVEKIKEAYKNKDKIIQKAGRGVRVAVKSFDKPIAGSSTPKPPPRPNSTQDMLRAGEKFTADVIIDSNTRVNSSDIPSDRVLIVGASTGGTEAIVSMLQTVTPDCPPILITQHMPEYFTLSFANRLNNLFPIEVREAKDGDVLKKGLCLIAPGNYHMLLKARHGKYSVEVREGPPVNRHRPSVDVLFRSAAKYAADRAIGIILTGMGDDGARGMKEMYDAGAYTIAQDEASCVVYGMPKEAVKLGGVHKEMPIDKILPHALSKAR